MTLIEIFSGSPIENFISTLALKPQKTIFVAPDTKKVWREIPRYKKILSGRGLQCEMDAVRASRNDLDDICGVLEGILSDENENYVVDISGKISESGTHDELAALGGLYAKLYNLQKEKYTIKEV